MLVVVEGMDNSGKTTLANKLMEHFDLTYTKPVPSEGPEGMDGEYMMNGMKKLFQEVRDGANYISDRVNLVSELIYGPICRGASRLSQEQYAEILPEFVDLYPVVFFCRPKVDTILKGLKDSFQMEGVAEKGLILCKTYEAYFDGWHMVGIPFYNYNWEADPNARGPIAYLHAYPLIQKAMGIQPSGPRPRK